jgi:predicted amidophosphoribosyltransferase
MDNNTRMYSTEDEPICSKCGKKRVWQKQYGLCNCCLIEFAFNNLDTIGDLIKSKSGVKDNKSKTGKTNKNNKTKSKGEQQ